MCWDSLTIINNAFVHKIFIYFVCLSREWKSMCITISENINVIKWNTHIFYLSNHDICYSWFIHYYFHFLRIEMMVVLKWDFLLFPNRIWDCVFCACKCRHRAYWRHNSLRCGQSIASKDAIKNTELLPKIVVRHIGIQSPLHWMPFQ